MAHSLFPSPIITTILAHIYCQQNLTFYYQERNNFPFLKQIDDVVLSKEVLTALRDFSETYIGICKLSSCIKIGQLEYYITFTFICFVNFLSALLNIS